MMHYSCDLCGKDMTGNAASRYVAHIEVFAAEPAGEISEADLTDDHLEEMSQLLRDADGDLEPPPAYRKLRFDLCTTCHARFLADPLNREAQKFDFSPN